MDGASFSRRINLWRSRNDQSHAYAHTQRIQWASMRDEKKKKNETENGKQWQWSNHRTKRKSE